MRRILVSFLILGLLVLAGTVETRRRQTTAALGDVTALLDQLQGGNTPQARERAQEIVGKVRALIDLPADVEPTVAAIVDVEKLRAQNPFYDKAKNGDFLVVTPTRAVLYDAQRDVIVDVVPVNIQPTDAAGASSPASSGPSDTSASNVSSPASPAQPKQARPSRAGNNSQGSAE